MFSKFKWSFLIALFLITNFSNVVTKAEVKDAEETISTYYSEIIKGNLGIAADNYAIPILGEESPYIQYREFTSAINYLDYLYPQSKYQLEKFEISNMEELEENKYHAQILLSGKGETYPGGLSYYQDVLVSMSEDDKWLLSVEGYVNYMQQLVAKRPIDTLTDRDKIYRYLADIDNGNYGNAALLISPKTSGLSDLSETGIISYLKEWLRKQQSSNERISSQNIYILGEEKIDESKTIYLISSSPFRDDGKFSNLFSTTNTPAYQFLQMDKIDGVSYINLEDGDDTYMDAIVNSKEVTPELSEKKELSETYSKYLKYVLFLGGLAGLTAVLHTILQVFRSTPTYNEGRNYSQNTQRTGNQRVASQPVDIASSVDQLLQKTPTDPVPIVEKKIVEAKSRIIHVSDDSESEEIRKDKPKNIGRKIHTDD